MATTAKDIMTTELILGTPEMTVEDAIKLLVNNRITGMPVVDKAHKMIGVVSEFDIIKSVQPNEDERPIDLAQVIKFSQKVTTVSEDASLTEILTLFVEKKVRRLPVLARTGELVGIITRRDIMRILFYRSKTL